MGKKGDGDAHVQTEEHGNEIFSFVPAHFFEFYTAATNDLQSTKKTRERVSSTSGSDFTLSLHFLMSGKAPSGVHSPSMLFVIDEPGR